MSTHDEYMTRRQARDLARRLARLERKTRSTAAAHADLRHSALDQGARIPIKDEQGNTTAYVGSGPTGIEYVDGPVPEQPSAPFVDVGPRVVKVQSSGLDVNENPAPDDLKHVEVHVAQDEVFEPSWSTFATNMDTANGSVTHSLPAGEWYVGLVWVTLSGKRSVMSEPVLAAIEPPVDVQDIQDTLDAAEEMLDEYAAEVAAPRFQALEEGLETHETNIADARDRLTTAEQTLAPLPGRIETAERDVETAKEAAESAEARAVEASNNASNRLTNGGFELGLDHWDTTNVTLSNDAHTGTQAALIGAGGSLVPDASIPVSEGDVWDVSAYAKNGSALVVDVINSADNTVLESFTTSTASSWSETGRLRVEVPADVSYVNIRITGDGVLVDDVVLRDVTDVVRLERAATAARQTAEQAISELAVLQLAVDGEGGLKDRLTSAETVLERKADEAVVDNVAAGLAGLSGLNTRTYIQNEEPHAPSGAITYEWEGEPHASTSAKRVDGQVVARNVLKNPSFEKGVENVFGSNFVATTSTWQDIVRSGQRALKIDFEGSNRSPYQLVDNVSEGQWVAMSVPLRFGGGGNNVRLRIVPVDANGAWLSPNPLSDFFVLPWSYQKLTHVHQMPPGTAQAQVMVYLVGSTSQPTLWYSDEWHAAIADTKEDALAQVAEYFDGDSEDSPAETGLWVRGDDKLWYDHATAEWVLIQDTGAFARLIANELFANLGVFDRLQAREGWIGGTLLADGAITAEKITATREMVTKIMGAEWAYIAERLVVDGELIANHADVISAAIKNLSVTERADLFEAFITTLGAQEAVIDLLIGTEAWIGGTMLKDDTVTTQHIEFTETLVGNIAELLHLVVDKIDVNSLWADQTWQAAGHFGSSDADQQTRVDGTGLRITKHDHTNETSTDIVQLGGAGIGLTFTDETTEETTGSLSPDGDAALKNVAVESLSLGGRPLQDPECQDYVHPSGNQSLISWRPRAVVGRAETVLPNNVDTPYREYGFIEVAAHLEQGRSYWLTVTPFLARNARHNNSYLRVRATSDGTHPNGNSPSIMAIRNVVGGNDNDILMHGTTLYTPPTTGLYRFMASVYIHDGVNLTLGGQTVQFVIEDAGATIPDGTVTRDTYMVHPDGNPDIIGPIQSHDTITTEWHADWFQNYTHNGTRRGPNQDTATGYGYNILTQGVRSAGHSQGRWASLFGFPTATESTDPTEIGKTLAAATTGADIHSVTLVVRGGGSTLHTNRTFFNFSAHPTLTAPNTYPTGTLIQSDTPISVGQTVRINIPVNQFGALLQSGDLRTIGINTGSNQEAYGGYLWWYTHRPRIILSYTK